MTKTTRNSKPLKIWDIVSKQDAKENMNVPLFNVHGVVTDKFYAPTKFGDSLGFKGDFVAVSCLSGEVHVNDAMFLPTQLSEKIKEQLDQGLVEVEFKATVMAVDCGKNAYGYAIIADEPVTQERISRREALLQAALKDAPVLLENKSKKA